MSAIESTKTTVNGITLYSLKNRRQRHEIIRTLKAIHNLQFYDRVFNESLFTELIPQQIAVAPLYENAMNIILFITLVHNEPVCFAIQQYSSQTNALHPKHRSEPSIWMLPLSIPREWKTRIESSVTHTMIILAELILPPPSSNGLSSARPYLLLERVIYDGKHRESMPLSFHLETLHQLVKHASTRIYGSGCRVQLKTFYSIQSLPSKNVFDSQLQEQITGFRFYGAKQPVIYYHNIAYKSFKVDHLDPFAVHRCRLLPDASNFKSNTLVDTEDGAISWETTLRYSDTLRKSSAPASRNDTQQVYTIAVNMRDPKNTYGVYHVYPPYGSTIPFIKDAILRLDTFEQHAELIQVTRHTPTIYLRASIHPYFKKWSLVSRNFRDNIVQAPPRNPIQQSQHKP